MKKLNDEPTFDMNTWNSWVLAVRVGIFVKESVELSSYGDIKKMAAQYQPTLPLTILGNCKKSSNGAHSVISPRNLGPYPSVFRKTAIHKLKS